MRKNRSALIFLALAISFLPSCSKSCRKEPEPKHAQRSVFFKSPENNSVMTSPVETVFGVLGMKVKPAMEDVNDNTSGHYHILIDNPKGFIEKGQPIPIDDRNMHFDKGETSASFILAPGIHTLTLQLGNGAHISYGKEMAQTITVTVVEFADEDLAD